MSKFRNVSLRQVSTQWRFEDTPLNRFLFHLSRIMAIAMALVLEFMGAMYALGGNTTGGWILMGISLVSLTLSAFAIDAYIKRDPVHEMRDMEQSEEDEQ
jgi:hypothetical protein